MPTSTVVTRVLRAMRSHETPEDGDVVAHEGAAASASDGDTELHVEGAAARTGGDLHERLTVLERRLDAAFDLIHTLQRERDELRRTNAGLAAALAEQADATERLAAAEQALEERTRRCEELEAELERLREARTSSVTEPAAAEPEPATHLAFVTGADGYRLLECPGPPPPVGSIVELPAEEGVRGRHQVVRVGSSTLPGPPTRCAYLLPVD